MRRPWDTTPALAFSSSTRETAGRRPPPARLGLSLPHSVSDVEEEVATLHTEMMQFGQDLLDQLFEDKTTERPRAGVSEAKIATYRKVWRPLMNEWLLFHDQHKDSIWQNLPFSGSWDRVQDFRERMRRVRDQTKAQGFTLQTPDPLPPKRDLDLNGVVKVAAYVGVGVGALLLLGHFGGR